MTGQDIINRYTNKYKKLKPTRGTDYTVWSPPVPRIDDSILDSVIYLYPTVEDAEEGERVGGSGFLVGIPSQVYTHTFYLYAVTNSHVIREGNSPVVRLNTREGKHEAINVSSNNWVHHPSGDDIAILNIGLSVERYEYRYIPIDMFITHDLISEYAIGPGDEVYIIGRFINHEGKQRNLPSVRFGNIAMMPWEPIAHPTRGINQESFVIEGRSISGYSGSPVFVHLLPFMPRVKSSKQVGNYQNWLLGIDWGHIPIKEYVKEKTLPGEPTREVAEGWWVNYNAGMFAVVPVWKLTELLNIEQIKDSRDRKEKELFILKEKTDIQLDTKTFSQSDFMDALKKVSRRIKSDEPDSEQS